MHALPVLSYDRLLNLSIFRSTAPSRPNNRGGNVRPSVGTSVRPYVRLSTKSFSDFNESWYVDRSRRAMHDCMSYDRIQGQDHGHGASEVPKIALFYVYLVRHLQRQLINDHWFLNYSTVSDRAGFLIFVIVFVSRDLELRVVPVVSPSTKKFFRFRWNLHDGMPYDPIQGQG